jgi:hypothetical protein
VNSASLSLAARGRVRKNLNTRLACEPVHRFTFGEPRDWGTKLAKPTCAQVRECEPREGEPPLRFRVNAEVGTARWTPPPRI